MPVKEVSSLRRMLRLQILLGALGCLTLVALGQINHALSFLCGVLLMAVNGWWLAMRLDKASGLGVEAGQRSLYAGAAIRFVALIAGLLLAHVAGLHLLLVAAGMFVAQVSVFVLALAGFREECVAKEQGININSLKK
jgi:hypothetical protein